MPIQSIKRRGRPKHPRDHALTKANGESVSVRWPIRNSGTGRGWAQFRLEVPASGATSKFSPVHAIEPGTTFTLAATFNPVLPSVDTTYLAILFVQELNSDGFLINSEKAQHVFTLTTPRSDE